MMKQNLMQSETKWYSINLIIFLCANIKTGFAVNLIDYDFIIKWFFSCMSDNGALKASAVF